MLPLWPVLLLKELHALLSTATLPWVLSTRFVMRLNRQLCHILLNVDYHWLQLPVNLSQKLHEQLVAYPPSAFALFQLHTCHLCPGPLMRTKSNSIFLNALFFVAINISADHGFESCIKQRKTDPLDSISLPCCQCIKMNTN